MSNINYRRAVRLVGEAKVVGFVIPDALLATAARLGFDPDVVEAPAIGIDIEVFRSKVAQEFAAEGWDAVMADAPVVEA